MKLPRFAKSGNAHRKPPSAALYHTEIIADVLVPEQAQTVRFFSRRLIRPAKTRLFDNKDLRESLLFAFYLGVAALVPVRRWAAICDWASGLRLKRHMRKDFPRFIAPIRSILGGTTDARKLFRARLAALHRRRLQVAAHLAGRGWSPTIRLEGLEGLQAALRRGHGAILWCDQFTSQTIMGKRALQQAGVEAHQVSVDSHGISLTAFGLRMLNPPIMHVENRFLKSRIVFAREDTYQLTSRVQKILKANGVVLMTNTIHAGSTFTEVTMGESGWTHLASTPANFAARGKAALFAMSTFETVPFSEYRAVISSELTPAASGTEAAGVRDNAKNLTLQAHYILLKRDHLQDAIRLYPEQMMHWSDTDRLTERRDETRPFDDARLSDAD